MKNKIPIKGLAANKPKAKPGTKTGDKIWRFESVPTYEDGTRLDRFLRRLIPGLGQGQIERMLRNGLIRLDGAKAKAATRLKQGQAVRLPPIIPEIGMARLVAAPRIVACSSLRQQLDDMFLAEGKGWLALNKPSGLAVQGGTATHHHIDGMLKAMIDDAGNRLRLVHRIDKDTSGVLLLAKTIEAARSLTEAFQKQRLEKTYLALVIGLPPETGSVRVPILKLGGKAGEKMQVHEDGQSAQTLYRRLDHAGRKMALVALRPLTGRTHQLRAHMAYLGNPICGDGKYAGDDAHPGGLIVRRLHLHAWQLKLPDGKLITAPMSPHMKASLDNLGMGVPSAGWRFQDV
ncbi:RluA family pseudouridine synthase [Candidatus Puniceispirillum sp.]|nr:RluA family pseudouridine synthase [Candidatus Puniceispirillum sp.]